MCVEDRKGVVSRFTNRIGSLGSLPGVEKASSWKSFTLRTSLFSSRRPFFLRPSLSFFFLSLSLFLSFLSFFFLPFLFHSLIFPFPAKLPPASPRSLSPRPQKTMQTSLCRSANLACAARPAKAAGKARIAAPRSSVVVKAEGAEAPAKWAPPALDANTPSPTFGGSTGGLLRKAQVGFFEREKP